MVAIAAAQRTDASAAGAGHSLFRIGECDIITQGRLDLCLGGRWGSRFGRFFGHGDISSEESRERVAEAIALIKLAWTQERVHFQGKYWQADNLPILPQPMQQPHPPLLLAANSNDTFPYAARRAWRRVHHAESADASPHRPTRRVRSGQAGQWHDAAPTGLCHGLLFRGEDAC
jgi:alkanesulfonate monooxygenase SsuD/methylene tetrahydromethanopterin reductase-like flavin-dependent oxidoreductase (luciferase family)